jgi:tetratricopeptide (TPR) repeat protein/nucleoside-triphosphatase THEP1
MAGAQTIVFIDIVSSTELFGRLGDERAGEVIGAVLKHASGVVEGSSGRIVKNLGDGLLAVFDSCRSAIEACVTVQTTRPEDGPSLRAGINAGDVMADGDDVIGAAVSTASRVADEAPPGGVLVTDVVRSLAGMVPGVSYREIGPRSLKGVAEPVRLHALDFAGAPAFVAPSVPAPGVELVGRAHEVQELDRILEMASLGRGAIILISGEPGIGKTRLAEEASWRARAKGHRVAWTTCWEVGAVPPFWAWTELLRAIADDGKLDVADADRTQLARVLPDLGSASEDEAVGETEQIRTFDAVMRTLHTTARRRPLVLIIDDVQWADASSRLVLEYVASHLHGARLVIVMTYRDTEQTDAAETLTRLARVAATYALAPLSSDDAVRMVHATVGGTNIDANTTSAVAERGGGNPFFLRELARLAVAGNLDFQAVGRLPLGVRTVIDRRLARLPQPTIDLLSVASLIGASFDLRLLAGVVNEDAATLLDQIEPAVEAQLCRQAEVATYAFAHPLIREALTDALSIGTRATHHRAIAEVLEAHPAFASGPAQIAYHFRAAAPVVDAARALPFDLAAGRAALARTAFEEAAMHLTHALAEVDPDDARIRCEILLDLGAAQRHGGRRRAARETFLQAASLARELSEPAMLARAAYGIGDPVKDAGVGHTLRDDEAIALLTEALSVFDVDDPLRVRLLMKLSVELRYWSGDIARADAVGEEAIELARRVGDRDALAEAITFRTINDRLRRAEFMREFEELTAASTEPRIAMARAALHMDQASAEVDLSGLLKNSEALIGIARRYPSLGWIATLQETLQAYLRGDLQRAEEAAMRVLALPSDLRGPVPIGHTSITLYFILRDQGRLDELDAPMRDWADRRAPVPVAKAMHALVLADLGRHDESRARLRSLLAPGALWEDTNLNPSLWLLSMTAFALQDVDAARELDVIVSELQWRGIAFGFPSIIFGSLNQAEAVLAATVGDRPRAERSFVSALDTADRMAAPLWRARTYSCRATWLARVGDVEGARRDATNAIEEATRYNAHGIVAEAQRVLDELGAPVVPSDPSGREGTFRREGDVWFVEYAGRSVRIRDAKGISDIATLVARAGREVHVAELVGASEIAPSGSDVVLDDEAVSAYRARLAELAEEEDDALALGDAERAGRARDERQAIADQLSSDLGLGGRARKADDWVERARKAVRTRISNSLKRIEAEHEPLARHLRASLRTGVFCSYDPPEPVSWRLS